MESSDGRSKHFKQEEVEWLVVSWMVVGWMVVA